MKVGIISLLVACISCASGAIVIDGDGSDWASESSMLYPAFWEEADASDAQLNGVYEDNAYHFMVRPQEGTELKWGAIYFDLDHDKSTSSYSEPGVVPAGMDAYAHIVVDWLGVATVSVYTGCTPNAAGFSEACRTQIGAALDAKSIVLVNNTLQVGVEFSIPKSIFTRIYGKVADVETSFTLAYQLQGVWGAILRPMFFHNGYTLYTDLDTLQECEKVHLGAVIFSEDVRDNFFQDKAYSQLYGAMQGQLFQAGIPHDRLYLNELLDISSACKYKVILIPYLQHVNLQDWPKLHKAMFILIHYYEVSIVTAGNFMSNDPTGATLPGDPYFSQISLFGIEDENPVFAKTITTDVRVADTTKTTIFRDLAVGDQLMDETVANVFVNMYKAAGGTGSEVTTVATQRLEITSGNFEVKAAILASELKNNRWGRKSGRVVHFSTLEIMANLDFVWRALEWTLMIDMPSGLSLQLGRQDSIFVMRNDMDQSQFVDEAKILEPRLFFDHIKRWYDKYSFVGSYYINIGNNVQQMEYTDWDWARTIYQLYQDTENEMGCHSYTHPHNISGLTVQELEFEFDQAQKKIQRELGLDRIASAQPGAPEDLRTAYVIQNYLKDTYFSGGFSGIGAGYPGCFGYLDPSSEMVYITPNMFFDFTMIEFYKWTAEKSQQVWAEQWALLNKYSKHPIVHWPIHDYGPTSWNDESFKLNDHNYTAEMFEKTIELAHNDNAEFVTGMELNDRIRSFGKVKGYKIEQVSQFKYKASLPAISGSALTLGKFSLEVIQPQTALSIESVENYYAYDSKRVFVPRNGGTFVVNVAENPVRTNFPTRIAALPMRMELITVSGDGSELEFTVYGCGCIMIELNSALVGFASVSGAGEVFSTPDGKWLLLELYSDAQTTISVKKVGTQMTYSQHYDAKKRALVEKKRNE